MNLQEMTSYRRHMAIVIKPTISDIDYWIKPSLTYSVVPVILPYILIAV